MEIRAVMRSHFRSVVGEESKSKKIRPIVVFDERSVPRDFVETEAGLGKESQIMPLKNDIFVFRPKAEGDVVCESVAYEDLTSGAKLFRAIAPAIIRNSNTGQNHHVVAIDFQGSAVGKRFAKKGVEFVLDERIPGHRIEMIATPKSRTAVAIPVNAPAAV